MSKNKTHYVCENCGYESIKWVGKCPACNTWNTFKEITVYGKGGNKPVNFEPMDLKTLEVEEFEDEERIRTNINEFDRTLGGGIVKGSVVLIGGEPGIGKSTLVLQAAANIKRNVLYVTGEESLKQISLRARRLNIAAAGVKIYSETDLDSILQAVEKSEAEVVIIDSIQTVFLPNLDASPGTITQLRETTVRILQFAKLHNVAFLIVGHITKDGSIAGPKALEHIVDTVLQFVGERNYPFRILRSLKNRFGSTNEIGIFEMRRDGLNEALNAADFFLNGREKGVSGSVVTVSMEGTRPILLEVQALVVPTHFGNPQRVATGFDYKRLSILLAVIEKRVKLRVSQHNVFLNMSGGIKIDEPAVDLAVCIAIVSSLKNFVPSARLAAIGEVGLGGEIRGVNYIEKRINETLKLGFSKILLPKANQKSLKEFDSGKLIFVESLNQAILFARQFQENTSGNQIRNFSGEKGED